MPNIVYFGIPDGDIGRTGRFCFSLVGWRNGGNMTPPVRHPPGKRGTRESSPAG